MTTATPPSQPARTRVGVRSIHINQQEGTIGNLINTTVSTFRAANALLGRICSQADPKGQYLKVAFTVTYLDGDTYQGRYDAKHPDANEKAAPDLAAHMRSHVEYLAGYRCPSHLDVATYEHQLMQREKATPGCGEKARAWLKTYSLIDDPSDLPAAVEIRETPMPPLSVPLRLANYDVIRERLAVLITGTSITLKEMEDNAEALKRAGNEVAHQVAKSHAMQIRKALAALIQAKDDISR